MTVLVGLSDGKERSVYRSYESKMPSVGTRGSGKIAKGKNYTDAKSLDPRFNRGNGGL